jgi:hypothetical protein
VLRNDGSDPTPNLGVPANLQTNVMRLARGEVRIQTWVAWDTCAAQSGKDSDQHSPQKFDISKSYIFAASQLCLLSRTVGSDFM